jgi:hypothetical protein
MSHGLKMVLSRNGFDDIEPEMVSKTWWNAFCNIASCRLELMLKQFHSFPWANVLDSIFYLKLK